MWVLVWNYHDDDLPADAAPVSLAIDGAADGRPKVTEFRVDQQHGNAYEAWKAMGSPQAPDAKQYAQLEKAGQLAQLGPPTRHRVERGQLQLTLTLPRQAVSLLTIKY
jgi:xylan 1,4-beta-xylosidase